MSITVNLDALEPDLRTQYESFEAEKAAYVAQQANLVALDQEVLRLRQQANNVETMARHAETAYKQLACQPGIDQSEISAEIARVSTMRHDAQALTVTADARSSIRGPCVVRLAEMRNKLECVPAVINATYRRHLLRHLSERTDIHEYLLQMYGVCRSLAVPYVPKQAPMTQTGADIAKDFIRKRTMADIGGMQPQHDAIAWKAFTDHLNKMLMESGQSASHPVLAELPGPVAGEAVARSPVQMMQLKREYS
jgi:hypothetical protein